jgi:hypothetical protein
MVFIVCPRCDHREPLGNRRGKFGAEVFTCPVHGEFGPGAVRRKRRLRHWYAVRRWARRWLS